MKPDKPSHLAPTENLRAFGKGDASTKFKGFDRNRKPNHQETQRNPRAQGQFERQNNQDNQEYQYQQQEVEGNPPVYGNQKESKGSESFERHHPEPDLQFRGDDNKWIDQPGFDSTGNKEEEWMQDDCEMDYSDSFNEQDTDMREPSSSIHNSRKRPNDPEDHIRYQQWDDMP